MSVSLTSLVPPTDISTSYLHCDCQRLNSQQGLFVTAYPWRWWHKAKGYAILYYLPLPQQTRTKHTENSTPVNTVEYQYNEILGTSEINLL